MKNSNKKLRFESHTKYIKLVYRISQISFVFFAVLPVGLIGGLRGIAISIVLSAILGLPMELLGRLVRISTEIGDETVTIQIKKQTSDASLGGMV